MTGRGYGRSGRDADAVEVVRGIYAAFARRDLEAMLALAAPDIVLTLQGTSSRVGRTEPYRGHDGVREYFADAARAWEGLTLVADDIRAVSQGVVVFGHVEGVAEGAPVRRRVVWVWQVRDGLAVSVRASDVGEFDDAGPQGPAPPDAAQD